MGLSLRHLFGGFLRRKSCADGFCQVEGRALAPKVRKKYGGSLADHMIVKCDDVDVRGAQGFEHGRDFSGGHHEITIDSRGAIGTGKRRPSG